MQNTLHTLLFDKHDNPLHTLATPYDTLPPVIQNALLSRRRIILIANNPSISQAKLEALLQPTDMLVLFNDFVHFVNQMLGRQKFTIYFFGFGLNSNCFPPNASSALFAV